MTSVDGLILLIYFLIMVGLGFGLRGRASRNLDEYFLGGRRISWLALAMSGSVSNFDITGTMWIVSILFVLGMKSMWHHWMWGFLMGAFFLSYMGSWVRRSRVMTAAEWMTTRFGDGPAGRLARTSYALMAVVTQAGFIGYAFQGIGKFAAVLLPLEQWGAGCSIPFVRQMLTRSEPEVLAVAIISLTTLYVLLGGLLSVVYTDVIQTLLLTLGSLLIAGIAWARLTPGALGRLPHDFTSLRIPWRIPEFTGTEFSGFEFFGALAIVWILKGLLLNAGGPAQMYDFQRFLAARNDRDAARMGAAWSLFLIVRWAMVMGITLLALTGSAETADPERVMPSVLRDVLPSGLRGLVAAGLLAAFMSTFSSTVNSGASFIVRDLWQPFASRATDGRRAVRFGYLATLGLVAAGAAIGFQAGSITRIWNWLMMALGAGIIVPNVLRWYWWRMNGWGYSLGTLAGIVLSLLRLMRPDLPDERCFPWIVLGSTVFCILGSILTPPVEYRRISSFYGTVRPFGIWGGVRRRLPQPVPRPSPPPARALLNTLLGMAAIAGFYLAPMYFVGHWYAQAALWAGLGAAASAVLKKTWYDALPAV